MLHIVNISTIKLILKKVLFLLLVCAALIKCSEQHDASTKNPIARISYNNLPYDIHQLMYSNYLYNEYDLSINLKRAALCLGLTCKKQYELCKKFAIPFIEEMLLDFICKKSYNRVGQNYHIPFDTFTLIRPSFFYTVLIEIETIKKKYNTLDYYFTYTLNNALKNALTLRGSYINFLDTGTLPNEELDKSKSYHNDIYKLKCITLYSEYIDKKYPEYVDAVSVHSLEKYELHLNLTNIHISLLHERLGKEKEKLTSCDHTDLNNIEIIGRNLYSLADYLKKEKILQQNLMQIKKELKSLEDEVAYDLKINKKSLLGIYFANSTFNLETWFSRINDFDKWQKTVNTFIYTCLCKHYSHTVLNKEEYFISLHKHTFYKTYIKPHIEALSKRLDYANDQDDPLIIQEVTQNFKRFVNNFEELLSDTYQDNDTESFINMHELNVFEKYECFFQLRPSYTLFFKGPCDFKKSLYILFQHLQQKARKENNNILTITIQSTEKDIANHFKKHNELFLYAMYFNWFPNITFKIKIPIAEPSQESPQIQTNQLFQSNKPNNQSVSLNALSCKQNKSTYKMENPLQKEFVDFKISKYIYYLLYDINHNMGNKIENSISTYYEKKKLFLLIIHLTLLSLSLDTKNLLITLGILGCNAVGYVHADNFLSISEREYNDNYYSEREYNDDYCRCLAYPDDDYFFAKVPWYVLYALLRDTMLIYSIYRYQTVPYNLAFQAIIELFIIRKSLFWVPLFKRLWNYNAPPEVVFY